jgi:hypothetical protein
LHRKRRKKCEGGINDGTFDMGEHSFEHIHLIFTAEKSFPSPPPAFLCLLIRICVFPFLFAGFSLCKQERNASITVDGREPKPYAHKSKTELNEKEVKRERILNSGKQEGREKEKWESLCGKMCLLFGKILFLIKFFGRQCVY